MVEVNGTSLIRKSLTDDQPLRSVLPQGIIASEIRDCCSQEQRLEYVLFTESMSQSVKAGTDSESL